MPLLESKKYSTTEAKAKLSKWISAENHAGVVPMVYPTTLEGVIGT